MKKDYNEPYYPSMMPASTITPLKLIKNTEVTLNFTCNTKFGEKVALIGSMKLLGHWDTSRAVPLNTNP
jgi:hypothetical protein